MIRVLPALARVLLRHDALASLCQATAGLVGPGRADWRTLTNTSAREGQQLLRDAGVSDDDGRRAIAEARALNAALLGSLAMTGRHALAFRTQAAAGQAVRT